MNAKEKALQEFRESRRGAISVNPYTVFVQGGEACERANATVMPERWHPATDEVRSSGWSGVR